MRCARVLRTYVWRESRKVAECAQPQRRLLLAVALRRLHHCAMVFCGHVQAQNLVVHQRQFVQAQHARLKLVHLAEHERVVDVKLGGWRAQQRQRLVERLAVLALLVRLEVQFEQRSVDARVAVRAPVVHNALQKRHQLLRLGVVSPRARSRGARDTPDSQKCE